MVEIEQQIKWWEWDNG